MPGIENGGPLLMVDSVTKRYKLPSGYEVETLGGISLELRKGEMLGLFGPNGAGKATLVSIITGLISADSGSVKWGDIERNRRFGYVSQKGGLQY